jgi:hypothetical protein
MDHVTPSQRVPSSSLGRRTPSDLGVLVIERVRRGVFGAGTGRTAASSHASSWTISEPLTLHARRELGALLVPLRPAHPRSDRIPLSRFGQLPGDLVDHRPTEPAARGRGRRVFRAGPAAAPDRVPECAATYSQRIWPDDERLLGLGAVSRSRDPGARSATPGTSPVLGAVLSLR